MTSLTIGIIGICILLFFLLSGMPIGFAMGLVGFTGFAYIRGLDPAFGIIMIVPFRTFAEYGLSVVPLFILMGSFCFYAGISKDLYETVHKWMGHMRGGLAMATVGACAGFAAVSGSSLATAATMGTVALPEMRRYGYDDRLATGAVACGGTIGILIPPSVALIIYGVITEQSIGKLFLGGFFPGILEAVFYLFTIALVCKANPKLGPRGPKIPLNEKIASFKNTWIVVALFVLVIGGIYTGVFSPTEAAGVGAFGAFLFALARRRLDWEKFKSSLNETGKTSAMIFSILLGAIILGYFLSVSRLPFQLAGIIGDLPVNRYVILIFILIIYMILGCVMDALAIMLLVTPIFFPLILSLGFDPIWFAILIVRVSEIGMITPPVGMNVFIIKGVAKDVPMSTIFAGIVPFLIADILHVALLIAFPSITLFLPDLMT